MQCLVTTDDDIRQLGQKLEAARSIGFDTECSGPSIGKVVNPYTANLTGFSLYVLGDSYYIPTGHLRGNAHESWQELLDGMSRVGEVWAHNWSYDLKVLRANNLPTPGFEALRDSMVACWLANMPDKHGKYGLKGLVESYFNVTMTSYKDTLGKHGSFAELEVQEAFGYAAEDAAQTYHLGQKASSKLSEMGLLETFAGLECPFVWALDHMESSGMRVDIRGLSGLHTELMATLTDLEEEWDCLFPGILITSPVQLRSFFVDGTWPSKGVAKTAKGALKVDRKTLEDLVGACPDGSLGAVAAEIKLSYQDHAKVASTYTSSLAEIAGAYPDGRLHPSYHHTGTATGRLSCSKPNLQNIPSADKGGVKGQLGAKVKAMFIPREGYVFVSADFSQIELRVLAHYAGGKLAEAYKTGKDLHTQTAAYVYGVPEDNVTPEQRGVGKTLNFAVVYGAGPKRVSSMLGVTWEEATSLIKRFSQAYPGVDSARRGFVSYAKAYGYVETLSGRRRYIPELSRRGAERWKGERLAFNTPIQGGAADIVKRCMVDVVGALEDDWYLVSQVHDELTLEVPEDDAAAAAAMLKRVMERDEEISIPMVADPKTGKNWAETK